MERSVTSREVKTQEIRWEGPSPANSPTYRDVTIPIVSNSPSARTETRRLALSDTGALQRATVGFEKIARMIIDLKREERGRISKNLILCRPHPSFCFFIHIPQLIFYNNRWLVHREPWLGKLVLLSHFGLSSLGLACSCVCLGPFYLR